MDAMQTATPPAAVPGRVLVADDDEAFRLALGKVLSRSGFECEYAGSAAEAIEMLRTKEYDVLLSDINMPGNARLELIANLPAVIEGLPIILLTGDPTAENRVAFRAVARPGVPDQAAGFRGVGQLLTAAVTERRDLRLLNDNRRRIQNWDRELEHILRLLQQAPEADRRATMQSYVRLTLRQLLSWAWLNWEIFLSTTVNGGHRSGGGETAVAQCRGQNHRRPAKNQGPFQKQGAGRTAERTGDHHPAGLKPDGGFDGNRHFNGFQILPAGGHDLGAIDILFEFVLDHVAQGPPPRPRFSAATCLPLASKNSSLEMLSMSRRLEKVTA